MSDARVEQADERERDLIRHITEDLIRLMGGRLVWFLSLALNAEQDLRRLVPAPPGNRRDGRHLAEAIRTVGTLQAGPGVHPPPPFFAPSFLFALQDLWVWKTVGGREDAFREVTEALCPASVARRGDPGAWRLAALLVDGRKAVAYFLRLQDPFPTAEIAAGRRLLERGRNFYEVSVFVAWHIVTGEKAAITETLFDDRISEALATFDKARHCLSAAARRKNSGRTRKGFTRRVRK